MCTRARTARPLSPPLAHRRLTLEPHAQLRAVEEVRQRNALRASIRRLRGALGAERAAASRASASGVAVQRELLALQAQVQAAEARVSQLAADAETAGQRAAAMDAELASLRARLRARHVDT